MSDHKDNDKQYTVDEILAEYGRGSHAKPPKVVPFPERKEQPVQPEALPLQSEEKAPASQEAEPQAALDEQGVDELHTKNFVVRWKEIITSRFDGKAFKAAMPELYQQFVKASRSRRLTIN